MGYHAHRPSLFAIMQCFSHAFMPLSYDALEIGAILSVPLESSASWYDGELSVTMSVYYHMCVCVPASACQ